MTVNRSKLITAIVCASLAVMLSMGIRSSFGLFLKPMSETLGTGREVFSLGSAISNLMFGLPIIGIMADRFGARMVIILGSLTYVIGLWMMANVLSAFGLYISFGVLVGFGLSATTYVVVLGSVGQLVPPERRSQTFGIITALGSSGMFVMPPIAQILLDNFGWQSALLVLAIFAALPLFLAFGLPGKPGERIDAAQTTEVEEPFIQVMNKARQNGSYWLLIAGFFVCGFHVAFIGTHLPAYLEDQGILNIGGAVLSLVGVFNMVGSYLFGWLGDRYRKKYLLSFLYFARAVVIAIFITLPITATSALVFGAAIGFLWLATVPLTSGAIAQIFGSRYLSTLYGFVFFSHQIGAFIGVWYGGRVFDETGSYNVIWYAAIALGIFAALVHLPITEKPRLEAQPV